MNWHLSALLHLFRPLMRYWGLSLLNIIGLAIGFAAALIIGLYVRDELTYDRFMPGADKVNLLVASYGAPGSPLVSSDKTPAGMARWLRTDAPQVEAVARLHNAELPMRSARYEALELIYWADANIFELLRLKALRGNLKTALDQYDTLVMTRRMALRYFGREDVVGETLTLDVSTKVWVAAVLEDFPPNTSLDREIFVSGKSSYSMLTALDFYPDWLWDCCYTYVRLKPGQAMTSQELDAIAARNWVGKYSRPVTTDLVPLPELHFIPEGDSQMRPRGHKDTVIAMTAVACLILILAAVNFASLMSAQISERSAEMAIRNALGARRQHLLLQVLCEAAIINGLALVAGLALAERILPAVNALLRLELSLWSTPVFLGFMALACVITGTIGGIYPAVKLSALAPGQDLRASRILPRATYLGRVGWMTVQFCLLITLLISAHTFQRQWLYAVETAPNLDGNRVVLISTADGRGQDPTLKQRLLGLDGVEAATRSRFIPIYQNIRPGWFSATSGHLIQFTRESVDTDFFDLFGVPILAGKRLSDVYDSDTYPEQVMINRAAAEAFGYRRPEDAVGKTLSYQADGITVRSTIIGVVDTLRTASVREPASPMVFDSQSRFFTILSVRIAEQNQEATLAAIDRVWKDVNPRAGPIQRQFFSDYLETQYHDLEQQWRAFGMLSVVGICLMVLGLGGLSMYLTRVRLREMAIRNALGAHLWDIMRLRLAPFIKPLLIANLAAGLLSWLLMSWWLSSFDAHVALNPLSFVAASGLTAGITLMTLTAHIFLAAPARSSQALRAD